MNVFFSSDISKAKEIFETAGFSKIIFQDDAVALKIHFGEPGNTAYLKPDRVSPIARLIRQLGGRPFWTDANTLYQGKRNDNETHLQTAHEHGYTLANTGGETIIADEPGDQRGRELAVNYPHFKKLYVAAGTLTAGAMIVLTHFKGHETTGFGGALKNIGMGLGSKLGKLKMHQDCLHCPEVKTCRKNQTLEACWFGSPELVQEKIAEYAAGIAAQFKGKIAYINFITDVSPNCDCYPHNDPPVVPDIGIAASFDPVALDQACVDLVNKAAGNDKFRALWPAVDWGIQLSHAEKIGLGSRKYALVVK
ncbi:MAG: DUF362 domain-containing protein [Candidatus Margulisbacteria bacterium]|nr:DUF362 domain-containing protein [Candidatus Margulisiibacteriota bacterium]MBU1616926.1 DUF362 domain-containing protein [Candidatus Margulisiibacteriota bacterium]